MATDDETLSALAKLTLRHKALLDIIMHVMNDFALFIEPGLPRCESGSCKEAATVKQVDTHIKLCDHCAARAVMLSKKNVQPGSGDNLNLLRIRCSDVECWLDLPLAAEIRRLQGYVQELTKNDVLTPDDPVGLH